MTFQSSLLGLAWVAILVLALALSGLLRQHRLLLARLAEREEGGGSTRRGVRLDVAVSGHRSLLIFAKPGCRSCSELARALDGPGSVLPAGVEVSFVFADRSDGIDTRLPVLTGKRDWFDSLNIRTTPLGVVVDADGTVMADRALGSPEALQSFVQGLGHPFGHTYGEVAS